MRLYFFFFIDVYSVRLIKLVYAMNGYTLISIANFDITWHSFNVLVLYVQKLRRYLYNTVKRARITRYVHDIQEYIHIFTMQLDTRSRKR